MTEQTGKQLQVKEKHEVATPAEQIRPGAVFSPNVDIYETEQAITLLADLPGVKKEDLNIDLRDNILTLSGDVQVIEGENEAYLIAEYGVGRYYRQFTLSQVIDQERIDASLKDGVLTLTLPKVEKATPRTIAVTAG
ncbi:MAG: Hsp20/alpha crystallin family protein [Desulfosarcinaceae bacterium]